MPARSFRPLLLGGLLLCALGGCGRVGYERVLLAAGDGAADDAAAPGGDGRPDGREAPPGDLPSGVDSGGTGGYDLGGGEGGGGGTSGEAGPPDTGLPEASPDRPGDAVPDLAPADAPGEVAGPPPDCVPQLRWQADFDRDPTTLDLNGDRVPDWVTRGEDPFPTEQLGGGVWNVAAGTLIDTRPFYPFNRRIQVRMSMRSLTVYTGVGLNTPLGTLFWINLNNETNPIAVLYVLVRRLSDGRQSLTIHGKTSATTAVHLASLPPLPDGLLAVQITIDPRTPSARVQVNDDASTTFAIPPSGVPNGDRFATLGSLGGAGVIDNVRIDVCRD